MKHCFMILAHNQPKILSALLSQIDYPENTIIVHIDKKSDIKLFNERFSVVKKAKLVVLKKRIKIYWGHYNSLKAEYLLFEEALKHEFDYCHLLSGQDLLIKPFKEFDTFLQNNRQHHFFNYVEMLEGEEYHNKVFNRVRLYHCIKQYPQKELIKPGSGKFREQVLSYQKRLRINRCKKETQKYAYGWVWFTASRELLAYFLTKKRYNLKRYKHTHCTDEIFIQTDYYYSPYKTDAYSLLYVDWSENKPNPKNLTLEDYEKLKTCDKFYARKFTDKNMDLVEKILKDTIINLEKI